ncbi:MAG: DUF362 domain-containing protein [Methylacidiphilales bacterium]|nr:DUF362 domain-containing protein [Candidatus Methylacidiphilales bacterium]
MALLLGIGLVTPAGARDGAFPQRNVPPQSLSPVILTERPGAVQEFTVDPQQVRQMVNRALLTLTSASDIGTAWKRLGITPQDVVGIKITTAGGQGMCTHRSLVNAICDGLRAAGMPMSQIIIWDKFQDRMVRAGYAPQAASDSQPMIASVVPSNNYDPDRYYQSQMIGTLIWGDYQFANSINSYNFNERILGRSYYTQYVTRTCTKIVNVPVLSTNEAFGIDACMSSLAFGSVDNFRRFQGPPTYGDPAIPILLDEPYIQHKVVVHILDALVAQCAGGPAFNPQYCQSLGAIYVGRDPVAIDSLALPRIDRMRREMSIPSPGNLSTYVTSAAVLGLGTTDRRRIQFLRVP